MALKRNAVSEFLEKFSHQATKATGTSIAFVLAVLVIVVEALLRIGKRALKTKLLYTIAFAAFLAIFFLNAPFPLIVAAAALIGYLVARTSP